MNRYTLIPTLILYAFTLFNCSDTNSSKPLIVDLNKDHINDMVYQKRASNQTEVRVKLSNPNGKSIDTVLMQTKNTVNYEAVHLNLNGYPDLQILEKHDTGRIQKTNFYNTGTNNFKK